MHWQNLKLTSLWCLSIFEMMSKFATWNWELNGKFSHEDLNSIHYFVNNSCIYMYHYIGELLKQWFSTILQYTHKFKCCALKRYLQFCCLTKVQKLHSQKLKLPSVLLIFEIIPSFSTTNWVPDVNISHWDLNSTIYFLNKGHTYKYRNKGELSKSWFATIKKKIYKNSVCEVKRYFHFFLFIKD